MSLVGAFFGKKGASTSGNYAHAGRTGRQGGSLPKNMGSGGVPRAQATGVKKPMKISVPKHITAASKKVKGLREIKYRKKTDDYWAVLANGDQIWLGKRKE